MYTYMIIFSLSKRQKERISEHVSKNQSETVFSTILQTCVIYRNSIV